MTKYCKECNKDTNHKLECAINIQGLPLPIFIPVCDEEDSHVKEKKDKR